MPFMFENLIVYQKALHFAITSVPELAYELIPSDLRHLLAQADHLVQESRLMS